MAAGLGFKTFTTGEVLTAADVNGYLMQGVLVFASAAARNAAITSPQEGQFAFTKDTNGLWYYDGAAWVASGATGDIEGVTAGIGISGGGTSGTVTVTNSMATAIDAKGDLVAGTAADTFARLAVGADGTTLVADSAEATGLKWATAASGGSAYVTGKNIVINGGMDIWQRGTSIACSGTAYTADRWQGYRGVAGATVSRQTSSLTLAGIQYCARVQRDSGNTSTSTIWFSQAIETANSYQFANKAVVLSFYARAGANYSAASSALNVRLRWGTGTDQNPLGTWTGGGFTVSSTATLTTSWQRFTFTGTVDATATELATYVGFDGVGTAGAADYFEITGVQLEQAASVTDFSRAGATIQGELAACQRYYYQTNPIGNAYGRLGLARASSTTNMEFPVPLPVAMRIVPTTVTISNLTTTTANTITAVAFNQATTTCGGVDLTTSSVVSGSVYAVMGNNSTSAYIAFSAEL